MFFLNPGLETFISRTPKTIDFKKFLNVPSEFEHFT